VQPDGTPTTSANENSGASESLPASESVPAANPTKEAVPVASNAHPIVQPDGTPTTSANENSGSSESLPAAVVETAGLIAAASTTSQLAALVKEHDGDAQTQEYYEPGILIHS
jgi:hypothetical protein